MTEQEHIEWLGKHLEVLRVEPGDILVLSCEQTLTCAARSGLSAAMEARLPGHTYIILGPGQKVGVIREGGTHE